jgi:hypothetical protein
MRVIQAGLKPVFGLFVIGHGLAQAALPIREALDPSALALDAMPLFVLGIAMIGFGVGGLGVFVRQFSSMAQPAMVLAAAYSLVGIWRYGQGDLWWSAGVDAVLFVAGLTGAYRYLPGSLTAESHAGGNAGVNTGLKAIPR